MHSNVLHELSVPLSREDVANTFFASPVERTYANVAFLAVLNNVCNSVSP